jgi:hypothetical protein
LVTGGNRNRESDLKAAYGLDWPPRSGERGFQVEENVPASRIDPGWAVASAKTYNAGVIILHVVPSPDATPPPGFRPIQPDRYACADMTVRRSGIEPGAGERSFA